MYQVLATALAIAGFAVAQSSNFAPGYTQTCQAYYDECSRLSGRCRPGLDDCQAKCSVAYDQCRGAPNASRPQCASNFAACLGINPFNSDGTNTVTPAITFSAAPSTVSVSSTTSSVAASSTTAVTPVVNNNNTSGDFAPGYTQSCEAYYNECSRLSGRCRPGLEDCQAKCSVAYNQCRGAPDASRPLCASKFATCLGKNPFSDDGTNTVTPAITSSVAAPTGATTASGTQTQATTPTTSSVRYTGAANKAMVAGSGLFAGVAGLAMLL